MNQITLSQIIVNIDGSVWNHLKSFICFCSPFQPSDEHTNHGVDFMVEAAEAGDRGAMVYMGRAFETGDGLGTLR